MTLCHQKFKDENIRVTVNIDPDLQIYCQNIGLSQVLMNLLNNAYDAIRNQKDKWVKIETQIETDKVQIQITDSGPEISEELRQKIMRPFFTTKEAGYGTGLGLSISSNVMLKMNGSLYLNPNSSQTQFILEFNDFEHN